MRNDESYNLPSLKVSRLKLVRFAFCALFAPFTFAGACRTCSTCGD